MPRRIPSTGMETVPPGLARSSKFEKIVLLSPGFLVFAAGVVFLVQSRSPFSICDALLMFIIGIGWVAGCSVVEGLEARVAQVEREKALSQAARNASEENSRELEDRLTGIQRQSPLMMGSAELDGDMIVHLYQNAAAERFFGDIPTAGGSQGASGSAARSAAIRIWIARCQESYWTDAPVRFEYKHATDDGLRWLAVTIGSTGAGNSGQLRFDYTADDITERKKTEDSLVQLQERLVEVLDSTSDCVFVVDSGWRLTYQNHSAKEMFGYGNEILSCTFWDVFPDLIAGALWQHYSSAMTERISVQFDMFISLARCVTRSELSLARMA